MAMYEERCLHSDVCKYGKNRTNGMYCTGEKCLHFAKDTNVLTNADRIRAMSDEELAAWLVQKTVYQESAWSEPSYLNFLTSRDDTKENAINGTVEWLKQPAEVDGNG